MEVKLHGEFQPGNITSAENQHPLHIYTVHHIILKRHTKSNLMSYYFTILGSNNRPLYELDIGTYKHSHNGKTNFPPEIDELKQLISNASLDVLESMQFTKNQIFFKNIDSFYGYSVSIFLTQGNTKFIILSDNSDTMTGDDSIRQFCIEVNEIYVKKLLSPFYDANSTIRSKTFDTKIRNIAKKYL